MRAQQIVVVLTVGLMVASLSGGLGPGAQSSGPNSSVASLPAPSSEDTSQKPHPLGVNDPLRPLAEFWSLGDPGANPCAAQALDAHIRASDLQFLIATLPDPIDSRFGYRFDSILDDIQMAIESQGWNLDRFWLPWRPSGEQPNDRDSLDPVMASRPPSSSPSSPSDRLAAAILDITRGRRDSRPSLSSTLPLHRLQPGVLMFRKPSDPDKVDQRQQLLMLFLVGETPTEGLHQPALRRALELIDKYDHLDPLTLANLPCLEGQTRSQVPLRIRIVGPSFTGSERSLSYVINTWSQGRPRIARPLELLVVSGSASRIDPGKFALDCGQKPGRLDVDFRATVQHSDLVIKRTLDFLHDLHGGRNLGRIALLTESDTEFGHSSQVEFDHFGYDVTDMKFPFHISQVAVAYDKSDQAASQRSSLPFRSSNRIRIPFDETGHPRDIVPSLSPRMTAATDEFVMSKLLETIANEDYRYVGIVATDTRDVIFLASLIREFCPDVQIFTVYGDMLFGHPEYAGQLRGMLLATTYPLFSLAQRWDPPHSGDRRRHLFSHEGSQGSYNATLLLLGASPHLSPSDLLARGQNLARGLSPLRPSHPLSADVFDAMYDYGTPFDEMEDIDLFFADRPRNGKIKIKEQKKWTLPDGDNSWSYRTRQSDERPPLWFGVVGQRGIWPIGFDLKPACSFSQNLEFPSLKLKKQLRKQQSLYETYIAPNRVRPARVHALHFARQFISLVPHTTWSWGTLFLFLTSFIWLLYFAIARIATGPAESVSKWEPIELFRPGSHRRFRTLLFILLWLALAACYLVCSVVPVHIILSDSSWRVFWISEARGLMSTGDFWNWCFSSLVVFVTSASCFLGVYLAVLWVEVLFQVPVYRYLAYLRGIAAALTGLVLTGLSATDPTIASLALILSAVCALFMVLVESVIRLASWQYGDQPRASNRQLQAIGWLMFVSLVLLLACAAGWLLTDLDAAAARDLDAARNLHHPLLYIERAFNLGNGLSPLLPVFLLFLAAAILILGQLRELLLTSRFPLNPPFIYQPHDPSSGRFKLLHSRLLQLDDRLRLLGFRTVEAIPWPFFFAGFLLLTAILKLLFSSVPTVDALPLGGFRINGLLLAFCLLILATCLIAARFFTIWRRLARLLTEYARLPVLSAFDHIPRAVSHTLGRYLDNTQPTLDRLAPLVQQWQAVCRLRRQDIRASFPSFRRGPNLENALRDFDRVCFQHNPSSIQETYDRETTDRPTRVQTAQSETLNALQDCQTASLHLLHHAWLNSPLDLADGDTSSDHADSSKSDSATTSSTPWIAELQRFVALAAVFDINRAAIHLRVLTSVLAVVPLLLIAASLVYPLQPQRFLGLVLWGLLIGVVGLVIGVYVQMERNELLSRVARTTPNRISFDSAFWSTILTYLIPLLGLLLAQFPYISDTLSGWFEPLLRVAH